ncbi:class I SAM-dependent methyltransferase [Cryobacterium sp. SO2]|uniref:class I SAM-dependent methyltransferase n=1 Tax=Cryobacterium sp. SO2 TaxID=1897060 RepID=UPI00223D0BD5|nr:class I SAM-dependent methyltransferase [Cryobacterium sp. SO2]WEO77213.1 class I SAM-dependent methyltransferase [Cryobacterium sp. SO2]
MTTHALSFGQAVGDYERGRPSYPAEAVDWMLQRAGSVVDVVDVGAGTGKFTASLVAHGLGVTAVEPDPAMRARLVTNHPAVTALAGTAEVMPVADASADLITFAQSWHWVDVPAASAEVARVLRPGGALALVWNIRDPEVEWVERLGEVMGSSKAEQYSSHEPLVAAPLTIHDYAEFLWENPMTREELIAMVTSRSYVITMPAPDREALLVRLGDLLDTHPDLAGRTHYRMPYRTRVTIARP